MADEFKKGDCVEWNFGRGKAVGVVEQADVANEGGRSEGRSLRGGSSLPCEEREVGQGAAHKPSALRKV